MGDDFRHHQLKTKQALPVFLMWEINFALLDLLCHRMSWFESEMSPIAHVLSDCSQDPGSVWRDLWNL